MAKKRPRKLTAAQRRNRKLDRNPLLNPGVALSGHRLNQAANALVRQTFDPQERALTRQLNTATTQGKALAGRGADYYTGIAQRAQEQVARQQALSQGLGASLSGVAAQNNQTLDREVADAQKRAQEDASVRGAGLSGGGDQKVLDDLARARASASGSAQAFQSAGALQGANYSGYQTALSGAQALRGQETQQQLLNRLASTQADIRTKRSDIHSQRGPAKSKAILDLRQAGFDNAATTAGLGLKQADLQAQLQDQRSRRSLTRSQIKASKAHNRAIEKQTAAQRAETKRHNRKGENVAQQNADTARQRANKPDKPKSETAGSHKLKLQIDNALSSIKRYKAQGLTGPQITRRANKAGVSGVVLNAARDLAYLGYVSAPNLAALRRAGVRIPKAWTRRPKKAKVTNRSLGAAIGGLDLGL